MCIPRLLSAVILAATTTVSSANAAISSESDAQLSVTIAGETLGDLIDSLRADLDDNYTFGWEAGELAFRRGPHLYVEPAPVRQVMEIVAAAYGACVRIRELESDIPRVLIVFRTCENAERIDRIEMGEELEPPPVLLGVHIQDGKAGSLSGTGAAGALVIEVGEDMPAGKAGILAGDVIVSFSGETISGGRQLVELVSKTQPGDVVQVVVVRGTQQRLLSVQF